MYDLTIEQLSNGKYLITPQTIIGEQICQKKLAAKRASTITKENLERFIVAVRMLNIAVNLPPEAELILPTPKYPKREEKQPEPLPKRVKVPFSLWRKRKS